jgi:uroporphyrinogen decarboxylase
MQQVDRVPFVPAVYEHKAALIERSPSEVCQNAELLLAALKQELLVYDPDMLVVGVDVYNVEAEAIGCRVAYFKDSSDCPGILAPLLRGPDDLHKLAVPEPETDGRMPLHLDVAEALAREHVGTMYIRGAVTGPWTLAIQLVGTEPLVFAIVDDPRFVSRLLEFCAQVTVQYGCAFLRRGVQPILFDSRATPQLLSPRLFREWVLPIYRDRIIPELRRAGAYLLPLIIGGNTTAILSDLPLTGAGQLLCDFSSDLAAFRRHCLAARIPFRANVDARLVHSGPAQAVYRQALQLLHDCRYHPGFLLGCGIVAYDTPPDHVLAIRDAITEVFPKSSFLDNFKLH